MRGLCTCAGALWSVGCRALIAASVLLCIALPVNGQAPPSDLEHRSEFVPNGDGTVSYRIYVRNNGIVRYCCFVEYYYMDFLFQRQ